MSKPKEIPIEGQNFFAWPYEEQTQIKHKVLASYYKVYATKLGRNGDTLFFDCHGGCGAYITSANDVSYGSSILIDTACKSVFSLRTTKNHIIVCERDQNNYSNLCNVISALGVSSVKAYNCDYNDILQDRTVQNAYNKLSTLFFVDPFGYYDTPMSNMSPLMKSFGNEIVVNFMFDFLNRGIGVASIDETQITAFFGCEEWKNAKDLTGIDRESYLVGLYKSKLKQVTGAQYVFAYRLCYPNKDQTYYYLIHATNHIDGITLMKDCFASINNGRVEYLGKMNDVYSLFDMDYFKQDELKRLLQAKFQKKSISFVNIWAEIVEDTAALEKDLRATLKQMESDCEVSIRRIDSKKTGLKGQDEVVFK